MQGLRPSESSKPHSLCPRSRKISAIDIGRAGPRAHTRGRIGVATSQAGAPLAEATIEPGETAAEVAAEIGSVAVTVDPSPGAGALSIWLIAWVGRSLLRSAKPRSAAGSA